MLDQTQRPCRLEETEVGIDVVGMVVGIEVCTDDVGTSVGTDEVGCMVGTKVGIDVLGMVVGNEVGTDDIGTVVGAEGVRRMFRTEVGIDVVGIVGGIEVGADNFGTSVGTDEVGSMVGTEVGTNESGWPVGLDDVGIGVEARSELGTRGSAAKGTRRKPYLDDVVLDEKLALAKALHGTELTTSAFGTDEVAARSGQRSAWTYGTNEAGWPVNLDDVGFSRTG